MVIAFGLGVGILLPAAAILGVPLAAGAFACLLHRTRRAVPGDVGVVPA